MAVLILLEILLATIVFFCFWNIGSSNTFWAFVRVILGLGSVVVMCMLALFLSYLVQAFS